MQMTKTEQALLSFGIRVVVIGAIAILDYLSKSLTSGALQLPDPTLTVPVLGLLVSEADTWLVNWEGTQPPAANGAAPSPLTKPTP